MVRGAYLREPSAILLSRRQQRAIALALAVSAIAVSACSGVSPTAANQQQLTSRSANTPFVSTVIPTSDVGRQLDWLLTSTAHLPLSQKDFDGHFTASFGQQVSAQQLNGLLGQISGPSGLHLVGLTQVSATALVGIVKGVVARLKIRISVDGFGRIQSLRFSAANPPPTSWTALNRQLAAIAPETSFVAAEVARSGQCRSIHSVDPNTPRPLGSMFKLYVLGTLANQIRANQVSWSQALVIQDNLKSLSGGVLQAQPAGTTVSVE